jgi:hypothetical protein
MFRDSERSSAEQHVLLRAFLAVLVKFLPPEQVELAIQELGRQTDIAYERLLGARA